MDKRRVWNARPDYKPLHLRQPSGVRCGDIVWIGAQGDFGEDGRIVHPGDLAAQTAGAMDRLAHTLAGLECATSDIVKLLCFYTSDGATSEDAFLGLVGRALPPDARPAVTAIAVPYHADPDMLVQVEAYAMRGADGETLSRKAMSSPGASPLPAPFATAVRCGKMIFVSAQTAWGESDLAHPGHIIEQTKQVMRQVGAALGQFGAGFDDVVKINRWYLGHGSTEDFEPAALACAAHFSEPGPAATGIPVPGFPRDGQMIKIEVVAMLGEDGRRLPRRHVWPDSLWDWTVHLPYHHGLKCHDMIFLGGQVSLDKQGRAIHPGDMQPQTRQAMVHIGTILRELGADYGDVCKITTMYQGRSGIAELDENLSVRNGFFPNLPATTSIVFPVLAYPGLTIEIDAFAMTDPDPAG